MENKKITFNRESLDVSKSIHEVDEYTDFEKVYELKEQDIVKMDPITGVTKESIVYLDSIEERTNKMLKKKVLHDMVKVLVKKDTSFMHGTTMLNLTRGTITNIPKSLFEGLQAKGFVEQFLGEL